MIHQYRLQNGARVVLAPMHETQAVTVLILFPVGSRYEHARVSGVSHFLEHMMFKGTKKRPDTKTISRELDRVGADFNAYTSKDHTGYYVKIVHDELEHAIDITSDMLYNSLFASKEIEREKNVVVEEIHMYEDNPMMHIDDLFEELVFRAPHALGRKISGTSDTVRGLKRDDVVHHFKNFYQPKNMVVTIAGRFDVKHARDLVRKYFVVPASRWGKSHRAARFRSAQRVPQVRVHFKETEQAHLALGVPAYSYLHPKIPALRLLHVILGGNMSSRLFLRVRERHGLCYYIRTNISPYHDTGAFAVYAGLDRTRITKAIRLIRKELSLVRDHGVNAQELKNAKQFLHGKMILGLEESSDVAEWYGKQEVLTGTMKTPEERFAEIDAVTLADVRAAARELFHPKRFNLAMIGPFKEEETFLALLK